MAQTENIQVGNTHKILRVGFGSHAINGVGVTFSVTLQPVGSTAAPVPFTGQVWVDNTSNNTALVQLGRADVATAGSFYLKVIATLPGGAQVAPYAITLIMSGTSSVQTTSINSPYVKASGKNLCQNGKLLKLMGATMYPYYTVAGTTYRGGAWQRADMNIYINRVIAEAVLGGFTCLRVTNYLNNVTSFSDAQTWANIDYCISQCKANGLLVILDFSEFRNWLYTAQGVAYLGATYNNVYDLTQAAVLNAWNAFIDFAVGRYATETGIAYFPIAGEIPAPSGSDPHKATEAQYENFYTVVTARIRAADGGNHLISTGGLSFLDQTSFGLNSTNLWNIVDIAAIHAYSAGDRIASLGIMAAYGVATGKPIFIEEFGFTQASGDAQRAINFQEVYQRALNAGTVGVVFWNLGQQIQSSTYDTWDSSSPLTWAIIQKYVKL